jgi:hypothetical protein
MGTAYSNNDASLMQASIWMVKNAGCVVIPDPTTLPQGEVAERIGNGVEIVRIFLGEDKVFLLEVPMKNLFSSKYKDSV